MRPDPLPSDAERTLEQLETVVSEFMLNYPSHTQRLPSLRPGEHPLIAFVRSMVASMAQKEQELEEHNDAALQTAREKERFLANMSHEVRTPMNGIFGMVNLLLEMELEPEQRDHLETIRSSSESLLNVLDDILDYAKLNSKQLQLRPRTFELHKLLRDVLQIYRATADAKGVELATSICPSLPEQFVADDLRLKQVLSNLVSNALKFTEQGFITVAVQRRLESGRDQLLLEVRDTGIGIDEEAGETLFAPFRQLDSEPSRGTKGTGLGLAISQNLVELMGGRIGFASQAGEGTTFHFTVDVGRPDTEAACRAADAPHRDRPDDPARGNAPGPEETKVLLVEDNPANQKVARLILRQLGCEVTVAGDGREAVEAANGPTSFDLICMDVDLPVMNGIDATVAIRELDHANARAHILAMTGMAFDEDRERVLGAGMDDIITKPFDLGDLRTRLESLRSRSGDRVALAS